MDFLKCSFEHVDMINLIPKTYKLSYINIQIQKYIKNFFYIQFFIFSIYVISNYCNLNIDKTTLKNLQLQISYLNEIKINLNKYKEYKTKINEIEVNIDYVKKQPRTNEINIIKNAINQNMVLEYVLLEPEQIILQGKYIDKNDITDFISQIESVYFDYDIFMDITKEKFEMQIIKINKAIIYD
ncbi:MAG: hypothetical protein ATN32_00030 [Candidatus Epulonipiscium fishelsonii]|nr:MAG: hypothetical protein ATN32_00030 [Epulopiscium sp. AS2M-Bin002]